MEITNLLYRLFAILLLVLFMPLFFVLYIVVKLASDGPFLFKQKRMGKDKKIFIIYKIRTMVENAERLKSKYKHMNEYKPPIFKIHNDPRYTKIGKYLAQSSLDELPQLLNIIKGDMSFVGPRPLPVSEAKNIPKKYQSRLTVLPGMIPPWVVSDVSSLQTNRWLDLETNYVKNKSLSYDIVFLLKAVPKIVRFII